MRDEFIEEVRNPSLVQLMMIQQCDAVDVTLTPTLPIPASRCLQLRLSERGLFFHSVSGRRFLHQPFVLAKDGLSSGRFYCEVQISGTRNCVSGMVKETIERGKS